MMYMSNPEIALKLAGSQQVWQESGMKYNWLYDPCDNNYPRMTPGNNSFGKRYVALR